jgi:hypothetical protein
MTPPSQHSRWEQYWVRYPGTARQIQHFGRRHLLRKDFTQANNVVDRHREKLKELMAAFDKEAKKYNVYPLDSSFRIASRSVHPAQSDQGPEGVRLLSGHDLDA